MKIKDYNDAIEFFRTNDYQAADGAWSEFYQSEVQEPRITDLAGGGLAEEYYGKDQLDWMENYKDQMTFEEYLRLKNSGSFSDGGRIGFAKKGLVEITNQSGTTMGKKPSHWGTTKYDNLTADMKKFYKETTGKTWNKKDWDEGNYRKINKSRKAKDVKKKKLVSSPWQRKLQFFNQYAINQNMLAEENKLLKRGYVSARQLNEMLGRPKTESASESLIRALTGDRESPWLNEIEGVKKWKKSKLLRKDIKTGGGSTYFKMPDKKTLKGLKSYYENEKFLSDFKYGRIKEPSIKGAKLFYDDETLMKALRSWSGNTKEIDQNALKVLNSVFGSDNWAGPSAIKNLGRALSGEIKIEGIKVDKALGKKILDGMSRTANSKYGSSAWDQAAYTYAKENMENLFKNNKGKGFKRLYDDIEKSLIKILGDKRGKVAIDEVLSLRTGLTNDAQVYSVFSQVIDKKVNETYKKSYDSNLSKNFKKIREEMAKGDEADLDKIKGWTDQQNVKLSQAQKKYPGIKFANLGKFDYETGKFAPPEETFGSKRFADLPSDIQKKIRKDFKTSKVSVDVAGAGTQKEVLSDLSKASDELSNLKPKQQMELLKKMGYRCAKAVGAGETVECYIDDVKKTRADLKSSDVTVRAKALTKQRKALQVANKLPQIGKFVRQGLQAGAAGVTTTLKALGFTSPIGYAIEGAIEGGIYDYYRKQGYSHNQAFAETLSPRLIKEGFEGKSTEDVPWYGGAEKLREKELYGVREAPTILEDGTIVEGDLIPGKVQSKVKQYVDALEEQNRIYEAFGRKEQGLQASRKDIIDAASADIQDLARSGAYGRVDRTLNPESMASQAYNTAVERQQALDERRKKDYMDEFYNVKEPTSWMQEKKQRDRYKEMNELFPDYSDEKINDILAFYGEEKPDNLTYNQISDIFKDEDKIRYFADNFRMEKAEGGIASLKRK